jgi:P27 family predicted phage terminase small subunit
VLKLRGSWRGNSNPKEPSAISGQPEIPDWLLSDRSREAWKQLTPMLDDMGVLTTIDQVGLALLCDTFSVWRGAQDRIAEDGDGVDPVWVRTARDFGTQLLRMLQEFGLTPSARTRIQVDKSTDAKTDKDKRINAG